MEENRETPDIDTSSEDYAKRFSGEVGKYFLELQKDITLSLLQPFKGASILEVGGGHAQLAPYLYKNGFSITITGSDNICSMRLRKSMLPGSFNFLTCDLLLLPFNDRSFDVVIAFRLLPHVKNWPNLLSEMCRVAKYAIIVDYPEKKSFNLIEEKLSFFFFLKKAIEKNTRTFMCFSKKELIKEFNKYGFKETGYKPQFFFPMALHRFIKKASLSKSLEKIALTMGLTKVFGSPVILRLERTIG